MPEAEVMLWSRLRLKGKHGAHFRRQHPIGPFIADFACIDAKLVVEVDGATHFTEEQFAYDRRRDAYMKQRGWNVIRVMNEDVYRDLSAVCETILSHTPPPSVVAKSAAGHLPRNGGEGS
jgi:very-short-patch-repair endonuclease